MQDPFFLKIEEFDLPADDVAALVGHYAPGRHVTARNEITSPDDRSGSIHVLIDGWASKLRSMSDGRRQVVAFQLPGEICDLDRLLGQDGDLSVIALTDCKVAMLPIDWLTEARRCRPAIREMLWSLVGREHAAMAEQIVALGRRTSRQRVAFLLCDLLDRLQAIGLSEDGVFRPPLTQTDMADALGLSTVHVNRTLQGLREDGLIEMGGRNFRVPSQTALEAAASYKRRTRRARAKTRSKNGIAV